TFALFTSLDEMVDLTNIGTLFAFILVCIGVIVLRVKDPSRPRPFRVPFGLILPVLGVAGCLFLIVYLPPTSWLRFAAWLNVGVLIYVGYGSITSRLTGRALAENPNVHDARTAHAGIWLGVCGLILMILTRIADITRMGAEAPEGWWLQNSFWLTIPLILNVLILYPVVMGRANHARKSGQLDAVDKAKAGTAFNIAAILMLLTIVYLIAVFK
ncbi:MAG TPA: amino acid permease C-terminal domain-containing protein, partial [Acidobacteriota bacterium]|nr:amino acid permease C-terminal domain-containing protein [Acidobacteriota bacterium]